MAVHSDDGKSALEMFLSDPSWDPEGFNDPPLKDGEDPLLTRERVSFDADE